MAKKNKFETKKNKFETKKDFVTFFEGVGERRFVSGTFGDSEKGCALTHLRNKVETSDMKAVQTSFQNLYKTSIDVLISVNDNFHKNYNSKKLKLKEGNVKGRILAYLKKK